MKRELDSAAEVLQRLLANGKSPLGQQFGRWRLWSFWKQVVGAAMAETTTPVDFQKGTLVIFVSHSCQIQDLSFMKDELIAKINAYLGYKWVRFLRYTTNRREVPIGTENQGEWVDFLQKIESNGKE